MTDTTTIDPRAYSDTAPLSRTTLLGEPVSEPLAARMQAVAASGEEFELLLVDAERLAQVLLWRTPDGAVAQGTADPDEPVPTGWWAPPAALFALGALIEVPTTSTEDPQPYANAPTPLPDLIDVVRGGELGDGASLAILRSHTPDRRGVARLQLSGTTWWTTFGGPEAVQFTSGQHTAFLAALAEAFSTSG